LSTNGGPKWTTLVPTFYDAAQKNCKYAKISGNCSVIFAAMNGYINKSTNGGASWSYVTHTSELQLNPLDDLAVSANGTYVAVTAVGIVVDESYAMYSVVAKSSNGGSSYTLGHFFANYQDIRKIAMSDDGQKIAAVDLNAQVYVSSDGGASYIQTYPYVSGQTRIAMSSDGTKLAIVSYAYGALSTSTDSGLTWTQRSIFGFKYWTGVAMSNDGSKIIATAWNDYVYKSSDYGVTWAPDTSSGIKDWDGVSCSADGNKIAATAGGALFTYS
jgi:hypothetical protein